jgi:hypothetical protein
MKKSPFVWLGANRARKTKVGQKALLLDKAASAGLPVPSGAILLDELFQLFLEEGVVAVQETAVSIPDPLWLFESLYDGIRFPRFDRPAIFRPAFSALTQEQQPIASAAKSCVDMNDPDKLARALCSVWSVSPKPEIVFRRDVLVMEMVAGEGVSPEVVNGTAVTSTESTTDQITTSNNSLEIPQLTGFFPRTDSTLPPHAQRLQKLLRGIRRTFGEGSWQIDWLDDGEICWISKVARLQSDKGAEWQRGKVAE